MRIIAIALAFMLAACSDDTGKPPSDAGLDGINAANEGGAADLGTVDGPEVPCVELLPTSFPSDTVLKKNCYLCKQTPKITDGVTITMEAGVKIVFFPGTGLDFTSNEVLLAAGTAAQPIVFTGSQKERGHWDGLTFNGTLKPDSKLDHVIIEYAGNTTSDKDAAAIKATADSRGARFSMTNSTIRESQGWGLYLGGTAVVGAFSNNTLTRNTLGPASVASEVVSVLDAASTYTGNDRDQLVVRAWGTTGTWAALDVPYSVEGGGGLRAEGDWTIEAGATLIMAKDLWVNISTDAFSLVAKGTAAKPILFTGATAQRGFWKGINFDGSNNNRNALDYVTVEHAGNTASDKDNAAVKLTADSHGVQLAMTNTTIRESQGWGLYLAGSSVLPNFAGNTLTKNTLGPVSAGTEAVHQLLPASSYSGNDVDRVRVRDGSVSKNVTWQDLKVPYWIYNMVAPNHAVLTIAPGVTLLMDPDTYINVGGDDTALHAVGTAAAPITITGVQNTAGSWQSIVFDNTFNSANALDHCIIRYGGGGISKGWKGMIFATADSSGVKASIQNSKVENSAVAGISYCGSCQLNTTGTTFANNTGGDLVPQ